MNNLVLTAIAVPVFGSFLVLAAQKYRHILALMLVAVSFCAALFLLGPSLGQYTALDLKFMNLLNLEFAVDGLAVFMALCSSGIGALIIYYSFGYMKHYQHLTEYYFFIVLFIGSMLGLVFSANLLLMYFFWEITTICSWRLIGFYRKKQHLTNANKALYITFFGSVLMLIGIEMVYHQFGTLNLAQLRGVDIGNLPLLLLLIGMLAKSAQLPFQVWLSAASVAPSPVTALLHAAVLVKIGVYAFARIFCWTFYVPGQWSNIVPVIAIITALVSAACALRENDIKRILAYSTVSQIAYIFIGLSINTVIGIVGGLLYILVHGVGKAGLFLCAGVVEHETGEKDIRKLGGMAKTMPFTSLAFLLCALSIMGMPPFGGFWAKLLIILGLIESGKYIIAGLAILTAIITILYLLKFFNKVFMGKTTHPEIKEKSFEMTATVMVFAIAGLLIGIFVSIPLDFLQTIAKQMAGG
ncbi:MAG: NADH-quinone oxidoreductase subunit L [Elusimicrobia bacterium]|nr:NADH-quinone oxidoreductase subunit L [Elusimicrobiota bacterium]